MRLSPDQLKMKALLALEEGAAVHRDRPTRPSFAIRFALAYLYAIGDGERWLFDSYWMACTSTGEQLGPNSSAYTRQVARGTSIEAALNGSYRSVGIERTAPVLEEAAAALRGRGS